MRVAVIPGSFDPITNGHLDIIKRASKLFDQVIVVVGKNSQKKTMFTIEERVYMAKEAVSGYENISVDSTEGLIVEYARQKNACIVKGLRNEEDFRYEYGIEGNNKFIFPEVETVYLTATNINVSTSSSSIKEFVRYGVDVSRLVPTVVVEEIHKKFSI
ncbi:MAG: pantetheine-phosphate adenylyltransferase [Spirochaetales bacterium]|nr:pantetheine-phosphate adenylyltransferase [Candidatus Physcosoma equi]